MSANRDAFDRAVDRWNAGDLQGYLQLYADEVQMWGNGPDVMDRAGIEAAYQGVWATFGSPPPLEVHDVVEEGESLVARFTMRGALAADFMGVAAAGQPIALDGMTLLRFRGAHCVQRWNATDMLAVLVGLGGVPGL